MDLSKEELLDLFKRYVEHICAQEGTNYIGFFSSVFTEKEEEFINSLAKGHLDG